jgi:hypothetical protein
MSEQSLAEHVRELAGRLRDVTGDRAWMGYESDLTSEGSGWIAWFSNGIDTVVIDMQPSESLAITAASQAVVEWLGRNGFDKEGA